MLTLLALMLCAVILLVAVLGDVLIILGIALTIVMSPVILLRKLAGKK